MSALRAGRPRCPWGAGGGSGHGYSSLETAAGGRFGRARTSRGFMTESFSVRTDSCSRVGSCSVRAALFPSVVRALLVVFCMSAEVAGSSGVESFVVAALGPGGGELGAVDCLSVGAMFS